MLGSTVALIADRIVVPVFHGKAYVDQESAFSEQIFNCKQTVCFYQRKAKRRGRTGGDVVAALSLPRDCPSSALVTKVISVASGDEDLAGLLRNRQHRAVRGFSVLQQHQGFPDGFPRQFTVFLHIQSKGNSSSVIILKSCNVPTGQ